MARIQNFNQGKIIHRMGFPIIIGSCIFNNYHDKNKFGNYAVDLTRERQESASSIQVQLQM